MSLAKAIQEQNEWFHTTQDGFYSWFKDEGKDQLPSISKPPGNSDIKIVEHSKYIIDNGDYCFLLVGRDSSIEKLSPAFELSDENMNLGDNEGIQNIFVTVDEVTEIARFIPANSQYEFPLRDDRDTIVIVNPLFLSAVDEVYVPYFKEVLPNAGKVEEGEPDIEKMVLDSLKRNLVKVIWPLYYKVPWADIDEYAEDPGGVYLQFVQQSFSAVTKGMLEKSKGDMLAEFLGEDFGLE